MRPNLINRLKKEWNNLDPVDPLRGLIADAIDALAEQPAQQQCWCTTCRPITVTDMRFVVCPECGNKRCPKANDHRNTCTGSNDVGQRGSSWEHVKPIGEQPAQQPHCDDCGGFDPKCPLTKPAQQQEPVAWMFQHEETGRTMCVDAQQLEWGFEKGNPRLKKIAPLYTTPPQRKPLTDEQIMEMYNEPRSDAEMIAFARAIEAAHGIGEQK